MYVQQPNTNMFQTKINPEIKETKTHNNEHTENNTEAVTSNALEKVEEGLDPLGRGQQYKAVPIDDSYPEYIQNNQEKYSNLIKPWN